MSIPLHITPIVCSLVSCLTLRLAECNIALSTTHGLSCILLDSNTLSSVALKRVTTCSSPRYFPCSLGGFICVQIDPSQCFEAATAVIKHMINVLAPSGLMRSSPDGKLNSPATLAYHHSLLIPCTGHFIFASFASAFLLKVCSSTSREMRPLCSAPETASSTRICPYSHPRNGGRDI
jgi:hypothetical protein